MLVPEKKQKAGMHHNIRIYFDVQEGGLLSLRVHKPPSCYFNLLHHLGKMKYAKPIPWLF